MDPIGFALENFDAVGRWRDTDAGQPIDVSSALPDGTTVDGIAGVQRCCCATRSCSSAPMTGKLLMYALGRNMQYYDAAAIRIDRAKRGRARTTRSFAIVEGVVRKRSVQDAERARAGDRANGRRGACESVGRSIDDVHHQGSAAAADVPARRSARRRAADARRDGARVRRRLRAVDAAARLHLRRQRRHAQDVEAGGDGAELRAVAHPEAARSRAEAAQRS